MDADTAASEFDVALARTEGAADPWPEFWAQMDGEEPQPHDEQVMQAASELLRVAVGDILAACNHNPRRAFVMLCRLAGRSYEDIARDTGTSRQAVHKSVRAIARTRPAVADVLRPSYARRFS